MYDRYYEFSAPPFQLTPDSRFFFGSRGHSRAIAHLTFGLAQGEGFIVVTGEVGAGKTTLVERLLVQLDRDTYVVARIITTQVSGDDLFRLAMAGFGLRCAAATRPRCCGASRTCCATSGMSGRRCLLVVDEAQNLSLAGARGTAHAVQHHRGRARPQLQTILLGQPQFRRMLASPDLDQLRQRVLASYHLGPLTRRGDARLHRAPARTAVGWHDDPAWSDGAFAACYRHTGGIPRRINPLCSRVLLLRRAGGERHDHRADGGRPPPSELAAGPGRRRRCRRRRSGPAASAPAARTRRSPTALAAHRHRWRWRPKRGAARARVPAPARPARASPASADRRADDGRDPQRHDGRRGGLFPGPGLRRRRSRARLGQLAAAGRGEHRRGILDLFAAAGVQRHLLHARLGRRAPPGADPPHRRRRATNWPATATATSWSIASARPRFRADVGARARACWRIPAASPSTGYRAPTFSIGARTPWAFDVLAEDGYRYSSSIYPIRHDLYGEPGCAARAVPGRRRRRCGNCR